MGYIRLDEQPGEVYHYTHRKNLDSILRDGRIRRMGDRECWFCASLEDTLTLMRATVMMEGKPYYKVGGSIGRYPKFVPEDYVILRLNPRFQKGGMGTVDAGDASRIAARTAEGRRNIQ